MVVEYPWLMVVFSSTMAAFIGIRKMEKAHLLMPHQISIGVAVGWTMLTSVLGAFGVVDEFKPTEYLHIGGVFLPQQFTFLLSLFLRGEVGFGHILFGVVALLVAVSLLIARSTLDFPVDILTCVCGSIMLCSSFLFSFINSRVKTMLCLWGTLVLLPVVLQSETPPVLALVLCEELSLLNVKLKLSSKVEKRH
uniref:Uncharacterized protein n=1 Tax=Mucochytrium quahogii TaxID=96639 RepID=A0A7S2W3U0_9STRA|mmetsp:Transcript_3347/g.4848  ORF Transcript_3347/g.4848 Transcript_3347/m.4848 type:complete len:194 (+) Transcript_3347:142-723(+)